MDNIEKLKKLGEAIHAAKLGKRGKENHSNSYTVIDEYQEWRTESEDLFQKYFDKSNSHFKEFMSLPRSGNGYTLMNYFDQQYPIFKVLIRKIEEGEPVKPNKGAMYAGVKKTNSGKAVFISHATKDKEIIDAFVDVILHGALSVPIDTIFCVSTDGTKIKSGDDWRAAIGESLLSAKINFLIITPYYKESEVCLNEMGAAWVTNATVLPLIVEPINYKTVGVIQEPKQIEKLLDEKSLDRIRDVVQEQLSIKPSLIKSDRWTAKKNEFLSRVKKHISTNPYPKPMDRDTFNELIKKCEDLEKTVDNLIEEKGELESLVSELKNTKDKEAVNHILKKRNASSQFDDFEEMCNEVKKKLSKNAAIINGIIFKDYSGKDGITIRVESNKDDLDEAIANDYIDDELYVKWADTSKMREIKSALDKVSKFISGDLDNDFHDSYEEKYSASLDISNKEFWEEVFDVYVSFK